MSVETPAVMSPSEGRRDLSALQFRVERFSEAHLPLVAAFSEQYWTRPRSESYYRWRYLESQSFSQMFLALSDEECLGMVYAFRKPYLVGGLVTPCLEIFDWHSLPGLSGSGVGIRVMRAMMREKARLIGIGGTADAQKALPAMGWQNIGAALTFELPITGESLVEGLRRRIPMRLPGERMALGAAAAWFYPRRRRYDGSVTLEASLGPEVDDLYAGSTGYDLLQTPSRDWLRWLAGGYPGFGEFKFWYAVVKGVVRGWVLTRLYQTPQGQEGAIVDIFAPSPDVPLYAWMISEAASALAAQGAGRLRARATCPVLQTAFRLNRFRETDSVPVFTYPKVQGELRRLHVTLNHTDACLRPYPSPDEAAQG